MHPDINYILRFNKTQKEQIIISLKGFCVNTEEDQFDPALISNDCWINFIFPMDESLRWYYDWYEYSRRIKGKVIISSSVLWIKEDQEEVEFNFWPTTTSAQKACFHSMYFKNCLINLLNDHNGFDLIIYEGAQEKVLYERRQN